MEWFDKFWGRAERAQHRLLAYATISVLPTNLALWALRPFGADHIGAGLVLILAVALCYFKYRR